MGGGGREESPLQPLQRLLLVRLFLVCQLLIMLTRVLLGHGPLGPSRAPRSHGVGGGGRPGPSRRWARLRPGDLCEQVRPPPASSLRADAGLGVVSRHVMVSSTCQMPSSAVQPLLSTLTQISPLAPTFGWKILVRK